MNKTYIIVAMTKSRVIGKNGKMPWHIPDDLKLFKKLTTGGAVIMGRRTYESIGKPLPDRENIIVSNSLKQADGCKIFDSVLLAMQYAQNTGRRIFFIGGGELYKKTIGIADHLYVSWVKEEYEGDTFFPQIDTKVWKAEESEEYQDFIWTHYKRA